MKYDLLQDSNRWSVLPPHGQVCSPVESRAVPGLSVSLNGDRNRFFEYGLAAKDFMSQLFIGFKNKYQSFFQIFLGFGKCATLRVDARNFLNITNVALIFFDINSCKLTNHKNPLFCSQFPFGAYHGARRTVKAGAIQK